MAAAGRGIRLRSGRDRPPIERMFDISPGSHLRQVSDLKTGLTRVELKTKNRGRCRVTDDAGTSSAQVLDSTGPQQRDR